MGCKICKYFEPQGKYQYGGCKLTEEEVPISQYCEDYTYFKEGTTFGEVMNGVKVYSSPPAATEDVVNNPKHYEVMPNVEVIDIIRETLGPEGFIAYCQGNIIKYALRAKKKGNFAQDIGKIGKYVEFISG